MTPTIQRTILPAGIELVGSNDNGDREVVTVPQGHDAELEAAARAYIATLSRRQYMTMPIRDVAREQALDSIRELAANYLSDGFEYERFDARLRREDHP